MCSWVCRAIRIGQDHRTRCGGSSGAPPTETGPEGFGTWESAAFLRLSRRLHAHIGWGDGGRR
jgi:hypothetical protein